MDQTPLGCLCVSLGTAPFDIQDTRWRKASVRAEWGAKQAQALSLPQTWLGRNSRVQ